MTQTATGRITRDEPAAEAAVVFDRVTYTYPGAGKPALEDVSLTVRHGERLGILGPNGGGKSTLLKLALGLLEGQDGSIRVYGRSPSEARRSGLIGYVPQKNEAELAFPLSGRDVVAMGAAWRVPAWRGVGRQARERIGRMIELVGASAYADKPVGAMSGGQLQRILIARALAGETKLIALDEPTVGVDAEGQKRFSELLGRLHTELDVTILIVSHDLRVIVAGCDRVACLRRTLHSHVAPEGLTPEVLGELFSHEVEGIHADIHIHTHRAQDCPAPESGAAPSPPHAHLHDRGCGHDHGRGDSSAHEHD